MLTVPEELEAELRRIHKGTGISIQRLRTATESVVFQDSTIPTKVLTEVLRHLNVMGDVTSPRYTDGSMEEPTSPPPPPAVSYTPRPPTLKLGNLK